jgi:hypothetical protein
MFRTSCVHHQKDHFYMQFLMVYFSCFYVISLAGGSLSCTWFVLYEYLRVSPRPTDIIEVLTSRTYQIIRNSAQIWYISNLRIYFTAFDLVFWRCIFCVTQHRDQALKVKIAPISASPSESDTHWPRIDSETQRWEADGHGSELRLGLEKIKKKFSQIL